MSDFNLLIDGKMVPGDQTMPVLNPATEEVLAQCPRASRSQLDEAVAAAKAAFPAWAATPIEERRKLVIKMAEAIEANTNELAQVMASAAQTLKRITLELGGNDAGIVLDDVDPKKVAPGIFEGAFQNSGQVCLAIKRLYVHESVYDRICDELVAIAKSTIVDDGSKQGTKLGPLQNKMQYEKVKGFLEDARKNGNIIAGGSAMDRPGYFIEPTIVRDIKEGSKLVDEEQFGPVLPVIKYSDNDDVIRRANATTYGLGASVWSSNSARAHKVASQIEAGTVWINKHLDMAPHIPFGGAKQSGIGTEFAEEGLAEFTQLQIINEART